MSRTLTVSWGGIFNGYASQRVKVSGGDEDLVIPFDKPHENMYLACKCTADGLNGVGHICCNGECLADLTFVNNKLNGPYKIYYNGKVTSCGTLELGKREGETTEYHNDIVTFKGNYLNNRREGEGKEYDTHGFPIYAGKYKRGVRITTDYYVSYNAVTYKCHLLESTLLRGQFDPYTSQFHGYCVEVDFNNNPIQLSYYKDGDSVCQLRLYNSSNMMEFNQNHSVVYVGSYERNPAFWYPREGFGFELCHSVPVYCGSFHRDAREGEGRAYYLNGCLLYSGMWKKGQMSGNGICYCEDGSTFGEGEWKENFRQEEDGTFADLNRAIKEDKDLQDIMLHSLSFCLRGERLPTMVDVYELEKLKKVKSYECKEITPILDDSMGAKSNSVNSVEVGIEVLFTVLYNDNFIQDDSSTVNSLVQNHTQSFAHSVSLNQKASNRLSVESTQKESSPVESKNIQENDSFVLSSLEQISQLADTSLVSISTIKGLLVNNEKAPFHGETIREVSEKEEQVIVRVPNKKNVVTEGDQASIILKSTKENRVDEENSTGGTPQSKETPKPDGTVENPIPSASTTRVGSSEIFSTLSFSAINKIPDVKVNGSLHLSSINQFPKFEGTLLNDSVAESKGEQNNTSNPSQSQVIDEPPPIKLQFSTQFPFVNEPPPIVNEPPPIKPQYSTHFSTIDESPKTESTNSIRSSAVNEPPKTESTNSIRSSTDNFGQTNKENDLFSIFSLNRNSASASEPVFPLVSTLKFPAITETTTPSSIPSASGDFQHTQSLKDLHQGTISFSPTPQNPPMSRTQTENLPSGKFTQSQNESKSFLSLMNSSLRKSASFGNVRGEGRQIDRENDLVYLGKFVNGLLDGEGEIRTLSSNALVQKGTFKEGSLVYGSIFNPQTNTVISTGVYKNRKLHGNGILFYPSGKKYCQGVFSNEILNGYAVFYWETEEKMFEGKIVAGQPDGLCKYFDQNGNLTSEVEFRNGKEISVTSYYMNHCTCKAFMENGKREGRGQQWDLAGRLVFEGEFHNDVFYSGTYYCYAMRTNELVSTVMTFNAGIPDRTVKIFATADVTAMSIDESWRQVYLGEWKSVGDNLTTIQRSGNGFLYLPDGRVLSGQWANDQIVQNSWVTVYGPEASNCFPKRKQCRYSGHVWLDESMSLLQPIFQYHGEGIFYFTDNSFFWGQWNAGRLEKYTNIYWENKKVKYEGQIKSYDLIDPNMIHEYLPTGIVRYHPLNQNVIIEGQFDDNYNCINNPITVFILDRQEVFSQNADYSMELDNYNVRYGNF